MRHKKYIKGGHGYRTIDPSGGKSSSRIRLHNHPTEDMEGATKGYLDSRLDDLDGNAFREGELPATSLPEYNGIISKDSGSNVVSLGVTGVAPGTYSKVTVGKDGRVTAGGNLKAADVPETPFNKITDIPSDPSQLGITEPLLKKTGGTFTGKLYLDYNSGAASAQSLVTKEDVDRVKQIPTSDIPVGGIIVSLDNTPPSDYLRVNGSQVDKDMYPELYSVVKDYFFGPDTRAAGKPWKNQDTFNEASAIGAWVQDADLPITRSYHQCVVTKNRVYIIGGNNTTAVYYAPINGDGSLGVWVQDTNLPASIQYHQCVVVKNRLYMVGGSGRSTVYHTSINEDGSLGTWAQGADLPAARNYHQCVVVKDRLYIIGGGVQVYYASINGDGSLGTWVQAANLPAARNYHQCVVVKDRLYVIGGGTEVYYASINGDGSLGAWVKDTDLPITRTAHQCVVVKDRVYVIGGGIQVYYAPLTIPAGKEGGKNDYSEFYSENGYVPSSTKFYLPDPTNVATDELMDDKYHLFIRYQ